MLTKRIIPCLDVDGGRVVKGVQFFDHVDAGDPVEQARRYEEQGADELVFYDISASHEGRAIMADLVSRVVEVIFMPLTVGGGIRTLADATRLIQAGAEKVSLNSAAVGRPELIAEISGAFGRCATVVAVDAKRVPAPGGGGELGGAGGRNRGGTADGGGGNRKLAGCLDGRGGDGGGGTRGDTGGDGGESELAGETGPDAGEAWEVFVNGGRKGTGIDVIEWVQQAERLGAGEIVLNVMNADGTRAGFDLEMTAKVSRSVHIPVVASGGAGSPEHMYQALNPGQSRRGAGGEHLPFQRVHSRRRETLSRKAGGGGAANVTCTFRRSSQAHHRIGKSSAKSAVQSKINFSDEIRGKLRRSNVSGA